MQREHASRSGRPESWAACGDVELRGRGALMMVRAMAGCCAFVRWSSVLVLAGAAAGKALALRHGPIGEGWLAVPALALALVGYEATLAAWLMLGRAVVMGQLVAFVTFAGFGAYSLGLALDGARTCRCFGILSVPPHVTAAVDFALAVGWLLMVLDGQRGPAPVRSGRMAGCMACLVCLVPLGVAAWHVAGYYGVLSGLHGRLVVLEPDDLLGRRADFLAHAPGASSSCTAAGGSWWYEPVAIAAVRPWSRSSAPMQVHLLPCGVRCLNCPHRVDKNHGTQRCPMCVCPMTEPGTHQLRWCLNSTKERSWRQAGQRCVLSRGWPRQHGNDGSVSLVNATCDRTAETSVEPNVFALSPYLRSEPCPGRQARAPFRC